MNAEKFSLRYQRCCICEHRWYFTRSFCPACGDDAVQLQTSGGAGILYTYTVVHRAPAEAFASIVPFSIVLVDMQEGFRVMGHGDIGLPIGSPVICELQEIAGRLLPHFGPLAPSHPDPSTRRP